MPRSPDRAAPAAPVRKPSAAGPRAAPAQTAAASPLDSSPRMLAQRRQIQSLFGARGGVVQGYFEVYGQRTDDEEQFVENATKEQKEEQVWSMLKPALATEWKKIGGHHFSEAILEEARAGLLKRAFDKARRYGLAAVAASLEEVASQRGLARVPLSDRASPGGVGGTLTSTTPTLVGKEKHSRAVYRRSTPGEDGEGPVLSEESFESDAYTKGPSRRTRTGGEATTPKGEAQAWSKADITASIQTWACDVPLVRHLALTVWPRLGDTEAGRQWELKFREVDRLITFRDAEGQSRYIMLKRTSNGEKKTLDRHDFNLEARKALKRDLLANKKHPAKQQGVLYYDALLKTAAGDWHNPDSTTFAVKAGFEAEGDLSMILTHWRPILLFDWILAEDVMNNANDA